MEQYVCAFRGRRDSYQAPLALAEAGMLDQFITDAYARPWVTAAAQFAPQTIRTKAAFRSEKGIPAERVRCLWGTTILEHMRHRMGCSPSVTFAKLDQHFSRAAAARAKRTRTHLFLYSPYAWEAFTARYAHDAIRVLFQFHPHPDFELRLLREDYQRYPLTAASFAQESGAHVDEVLRRRSRDCWKHADLIISASTFTRSSLLEAGADLRKCLVVPYGVEPPTGGAEEFPLPHSFRVLFVGSGTQRKGLHHLILAWRQAALPDNSQLTLVCRTIDRGIEQLIIETPRVRLSRGLSAEALPRAFSVSALFVMPSLVEGFGQVYLEALAQGCPVLGTSNSALPDLGSEADGIFLASPGNVEELAAKLEELSSRLPGNGSVRAAARQSAARFPWRRFRAGIQKLS